MAQQRRSSVTAMPEEEFSLGVGHLNRVYNSTIKLNRDQQDQEQRLYHLLPTFLKLFGGSSNLQHALRIDIIARHFSELHHFANLAGRAFVTELKRRASSTSSSRHGSSSDANGSSAATQAQHSNHASFAIADYLMPNLAASSTPQPNGAPPSSTMPAVSVAFSPGFQLMQTLRILSSPMPATHGNSSKTAVESKMTEVFCSSHMALPSTLVKSLYLLFDLSATVCQVKQSEFSLMRENLIGLLLNLLGHHYASEELCRRDDLTLLFVAFSAPCARHVLPLKEGAARLVERLSSAASLTQPVLAYVHNKNCLKISIDQLRSHAWLDEHETTTTLGSLFCFLQCAGSINRLMLDDFRHAGGYEFLSSYIVHATTTTTTPLKASSPRVSDDIVFLIKMTGVLCLVGNHPGPQEHQSQQPNILPLPDFIQPIARGAGHTVTNIYAVHCLVDMFLQQKPETDGSYRLAHVLLETILHLYYLDDANYFIIESSGCSALCHVVEKISTSFSTPSVQNVTNASAASTLISITDQYLNVLDHIVQQVHCIPTKELSTIAVIVKNFFSTYHNSIVSSTTVASTAEFVRKTLLMLKEWLVNGYGFTQFQDALLTVGIVDVLAEEIIIVSSNNNNNNNNSEAEKLLPNDVHQLACEILQLAVRQHSRNAVHLRTHDAARRLALKISVCDCSSSAISTAANVDEQIMNYYCKICRHYAGLLISLLSSGAAGCEDDVQAVIVVFNQSTGRNTTRVQILLLRCLCTALIESHRARMALRKTGGFVALVSALVALADCLHMDDADEEKENGNNLQLLTGKMEKLVFIRTIFETLAAALRSEPANARHFADEIRWRSLLDAVKMLGCFNGKQTRFIIAACGNLTRNAAVGNANAEPNDNWLSAFCSSPNELQPNSRKLAAGATVSPQSQFASQNDATVQVSLKCFVFQLSNWDVATLLYSQQTESHNAAAAIAPRANSIVTDSNARLAHTKAIISYDLAFSVYIYKCLYFVCLDLFRHTTTKLLNLTAISHSSRGPSPLVVGGGSSGTTPAPQTRHYLGGAAVASASGRRSSPSSRQGSLQRNATIVSDASGVTTVNTLSERPVLYPEAALVMLKLLPALRQREAEVKPAYNGFTELQLFVAELIRSLARTERNQQALCNVGFLHELLDMCNVDEDDNAGVLTNEAHPLHSSLIFIAERLANQSLEAKDLRYFMRLQFPSSSKAELCEQIETTTTTNQNLISLSRVKTLVSMITPRDDFTSTASDHGSSSSLSSSHTFPPAFVEFDLNFEGFGGLHIPSLAPQTTIPLFNTIAAHHQSTSIAGGASASAAAMLSSSAAAASSFLHHHAQQQQQQRIMSGDSLHSNSSLALNSTNPPLSPMLSTNSSVMLRGPCAPTSSSTLGGIGTGERLFPPPAGMTVALWFNVECYDKAEPIRLFDIFRVAGVSNVPSHTTNMKNSIAEALRCFSLHIVNNSNNLRTPCVCLSTAEIPQSLITTASAAPTPPALAHQSPSLPGASSTTTSPGGRSSNLAYFSSSSISTTATPPPVAANLIQQQTTTISTTTTTSDFVSIEAPQLAETSRWYHVAVVLTRAIIKQSSAAVYVDGQCVANIKMPYISQYPGVSATSLVPAHSVFGVVGTMPSARRQCRLRWKLATLAVIEEALTPAQIALINSLGPAYHGSFQSATLGGSGSVGGPLAGEERILFGLNPSVVSEMTIQKLKRIYNKEDAKAAAKFLQLSSPSEMAATPVKLLHNSAAHLRGPARSIGAVVIGFLGFRSFMPRPAHQALISVGGIWCLMGLVAMSRTTEFLYAAMKCLTCSLRANFVLREQMRKCRGHELLAMMLKKKHHLLNSHVMQLIFAQCCCISGSDSSALVSQQQQTHVLYDRRALQELLCDLHLWQLAKPDLVRTIFEQLRELAKENAENVMIMRELGLFKTLQHFLLLLPTTAPAEEEVDSYCALVDAAYMLMATLIRASLSFANNSNNNAAAQQQIRAIIANEVVGLAQALASTLQQQSLRAEPQQHAIRERGLLLIDALQREQLPHLIPQLIGLDWLLSFLACSSNTLLESSSSSQQQQHLDSTVIIALQMLLDLLIAPPRATTATALSNNSSVSTTTTAVGQQSNLNCMQVFREGKYFGNWLRDGNLWSALCMSSNSSADTTASMLLAGPASNNNAGSNTAVGPTPFGSRSIGGGPLESAGFADFSSASGGGFGGLQIILSNNTYFCTFTPAWAAVVALIIGRPLVLHQFMPLQALQLDDIWIRIFGTPPGQAVKLKGLKLAAGRDAALIGLAMVRTEINSKSENAGLLNKSTTTKKSIPIFSSYAYMQLMTYLYHNWSEFSAACCLTPDFIGALVMCCFPSPLNGSAVQDHSCANSGPTRKLVLDLLKTLVIDALSLPQNKCDAALLGGVFDYPLEMLCNGGGNSAAAAALQVQTFFDTFVPIVIEHIQVIELLTTGSAGGLPLAVGGSYQNLPLNIGFLLHKFIDRMWRSNFSLSYADGEVVQPILYCAIISRSLANQLTEFTFSTAQIVLVGSNSISSSSSDSSQQNYSYAANTNTSAASTIKFDAGTIVCVTKALHRLILCLVSRTADSVSGQMALLDCLHKILDYRNVVFYHQPAAAIDAASQPANEFSAILASQFYCCLLLCLVQLYQHVSIKCDPRNNTTWHVPRPALGRSRAAPPSRTGSASQFQLPPPPPPVGDENRRGADPNVDDSNYADLSSSENDENHAADNAVEKSRDEGWKLVETTASHLWNVMRSHRHITDVLQAELTFRPHVSASTGGLSQLPLEALVRETVALEECYAHWMQMIEIESPSSNRGGGGQQFQQQLSAATGGSGAGGAIAVSSAVVGALAAGVARAPKQLAQNLMRSFNFQRQKVGAVSKPQLNTSLSTASTSSTWSWASLSLENSVANQNHLYAAALVQAHNSSTIFVHQLRLHCALVRNYYVSEYLEQLQRELISLTRLTEDDWRESELQFLLRERSLWGSEQPWRLQKWKLTTCEGYNRMRKKLVPNEKFYLDYPYRRQHLTSYSGSTARSDTNANELAVESDAAPAGSPTPVRRSATAVAAQNKYKLPTSADSKLLNTETEQQNAGGNFDVPQRLSSLLFDSAAAVTKQKQTNTAASQQTSSMVAPAADSIDAENESDAEKSSSPATIDQQPTDAVKPPPEPDQATLAAPTTTARNDPNLEDILIAKFMEEGDTISHVYRCARVQGLDTFEGLLLFGREHLYLIDGYTLLRTREIRDIETIPAAQREPVLPMVVLSLGSKRRQKLRYADIKEVLYRRYLLQPIGLEIFCANGRTNFVAFPHTYRDRVLSRLLSLAPNILDSASQSVAGQKRSAQVEPQMPTLLGSLIGETSVTQRWMRGEISNFQYLMHLNTLAGRSYNDLMQYPVFPWILADYDSDVLDFNNPATFRDLSKPMGAQTPERLEQFQKRYREWDDMASTAAGGGMSGGGIGDEDVITPPYHYGTHYSSAMIVASYLMRMEPFTQFFLRLQGGHFDLADRMFHSVKDAWWSAARNNMADVKELIPEAFYLPEFLLNSNKFELGVKQSGVPLNHVILPPWSKGDAREFIRLHRCALECDFVSAHLHEWIDLVFGYKQRGRAAEESNNVFHHLFYEGEVDLGTVEDPLRRNAIIGFINNFGQVPSQLFKKPHPVKKSMQQKNEALFFHRLNRLRCNTMAPFTGGGGGGGNVGSYAQQAYQPQLRSGGELLRSSVGQIVCTDRVWVAVEQNKAVIPAATTSANTSSGTSGALSSVVSGNSSSAARCLSWGFADGSLRVCSLETERALIVAELVPDCDEILCAACPTATLFLVAGLSGVISVFEVVMIATASSGGSSSIFSGAAKRAVSSGIGSTGSSGTGGGGNTAALVLKKHLYGHYEPVTCLAASEAHGIAVSGSKDRTCIMWDLEKLNFLRQLRHHAATVAAVSINDLTGDVAVAAGASIYLWDINGRLLARATINSNFGPSVPMFATPQQQQTLVTTGNEQILSVCFSQAVEWDCANVIVTGSSDGVVRFWSEMMLPNNNEDEKESQPSTTEQSSLTLTPSPAAKNDDDVADPIVASRRLSVASVKQSIIMAESISLDSSATGGADEQRAYVDEDDETVREVFTNNNGVSALSTPSQIGVAQESRPRRRRHISLGSELELDTIDAGRGKPCQFFSASTVSINKQQLYDTSTLMRRCRSPSPRHFLPHTISSSSSKTQAKPPLLSQTKAVSIQQQQVASDQRRRASRSRTSTAADDEEQYGSRSIAELDASTSNDRRPSATTAVDARQVKWRRQLVLRAQFNIQEIVYGRNRRPFFPAGSSVGNNNNNDSPSAGVGAVGRISITALGVSKDSRVLYVGDSCGRVTAWTAPADGGGAEHYQR